MAHIFTWIPIYIFWSSFFFLLSLTWYSPTKVVGISSSPGSVKIKNEKEQKASHLWPRSLLSNNGEENFWDVTVFFSPLQNEFSHALSSSSPAVTSNTPLGSPNVSTPAKDGSSSNGSGMVGGGEARLMKHDKHGSMLNRNKIKLLWTSFCVKHYCFK